MYIYSKTKNKVMGLSIDHHHYAIRIGKYNYQFLR